MPKTTPLTAALASLLLAQSVRADIINVPVEFLTIQDAIDAANEGDEVVVAPGTYLERIDFLGKAITVRSSGGPAVTTIDGEGGGTVVTCSNLEGSDTVLEGFTVTNGNAAQGGGMFIESGGPTVNDCIFDSNSATDGGGVYTSGADPHFTDCVFSNSTGEGMYCDASGPVLTSCEFTGNGERDLWLGGISDVVATDCSVHDSHGVHVTEFSSLAMTMCQLVDNSWTTSPGGGAIYLAEGSITLVDCTVLSNSSGSRNGGGIHANDQLEITGGEIRGNSGASGGGIFADDLCTLHMDGCLVKSNESSAVGGGVHHGGTSLGWIRDSDFDDNTAGISGGGLFSDSATMLVERCTFTGNWAESRGGGMYLSQGTPRISRCDITDNFATFGSGVYNLRAGPYFANCRFLGNTAWVSGGVFNDRTSWSIPQPTIANSLFSGNSASSFGGAVFNTEDSDPLVSQCTFYGNTASNGAAIWNQDALSTPTVSGSIIWGNVAAQGTHAIGGSGLATVTYSDIEGGHDGIGNIDADPLYANADGPDGEAGTLDDDLRPTVDSPCLDEGNNADLPDDVADLDGDGDTSEPLPLDLDLEPRIVNGTVDMGCYEFDLAGGPCPADIDGPGGGPDGEVGFFDVVLVLATWGPCPGCPADIDGPNGVPDGEVGFFDLLLVLATWGPCPG